MTHAKDDPRVTAYALGEMRAEERGAFEKEIAGDPAMSAEVEAVRALGTRLERALEDLPVPRLDADQRSDLAGAAGPSGRGARASSAWVWRVAALLVIAVGAGAVLVGTGVFRPLAEHDAAVVRTEKAVHSGTREPVRSEDREEIALRETGGSAPAGSAGASASLERPPSGKPDHEEAKTDLPDAPYSGPSAQAGVGVGGGAGTVAGRGGSYRGPGDQVAPGLREPSDPTPPAPLSGPVGVTLPPILTTPSVPTFRTPLGAPQAGTGAGSVTVSIPELRPADAPFSTEGYDAIAENPFYTVADKDASTFSIDVDTASYANVRRFLRQGVRPPPGAVRIEELINYFPYDYAPPAADAKHPFAWRAAVATCPWAPEHRLVRVALKGRVLDASTRPAANLVFLLDVSGSMRPANKLPLVKEAMKLLLDQLEERDQISIVVYAGAAGLVLPPTSGDRKETILAALDRLQAGGSTNGGQGIQLAYDTAVSSFIQGGVNRVILCTDGDFNVGVSDRSSLDRMIGDKAKTGVFLTVAGFGMGNLKDDRMEDLSNRGNGNYAYVDTLREARKVFVEEGLGTLVTIAKDVKIQVFFNPKTVGSWRLIGYENRVLRRQDFNDDTKDAGEIGAGHAVTALYEIVPAGGDEPSPKVDANPFLAPRTPSDAADDKALLQLRLRYKLPDADTSTLLEETVLDDGAAFDAGDRDFQWAAAVAGFGMLLRGSDYRGLATWPLVEEMASAAKGEDPQGYRAEFLDLAKRAAAVAPVPERRETPATDGAASPAETTLAGKVLAVEGDVVVLSVGSDAGVRVGDLFVVQGDDALVGLVTVTDVHPKQAAGRIVPTPGVRPVRTGDAVRRR